MSSLLGRKPEQPHALMTNSAPLFFVKPFAGTNRVEPPAMAGGNTVKSRASSQIPQKG
jgi:hypothetical protein